MVLRPYVRRSSPLGPDVLLTVEDQARLIRRIRPILALGGSLLFTPPAAPLARNDIMTGLESRSLGSAGYRTHLSSTGLTIVGEYEDQGRNHYFDARKLAG